MSEQKNKTSGENIYDNVKKKKRQAVLITVDGNSTVVNMAEQPQCVFVFFNSTRDQRKLLI